MQSRPIIGHLTKAFLLLAFLNFLVGAGLGGFMAVSPRLWATFGAIHGELNPYGWLTMLIYGMTYAVLAVSADLRPPWAWVGWLHVCTAELGVLFIAGGYLLQALRLQQVGFVLQAVAPVLFLLNILSAVFVAKRKRRQVPERAAAEVNPMDSGDFALLGRSPAYKTTDRIAQRGTDMALMIFVGAALWSAFEACAGSKTTGTVTEAPAATMLVYYGWIAGTVFAVWLHLFPRFFKISLSRGFALGGQVLWCLSLLVTVLGQFGTPVAATVGNQLLGVTFIWSAVGYLGLFRKRGGTVPQRSHIPVQSKLASYASWWFALALGILLLVGLSPLSLAALHFLFLGWVTTLVYGVGYSLFPLLLMRRVPNKGLAVLQVVTSLLGAVLMSAAFLALEWLPQNSQATAFGVLKIGGLLAVLGALWFLLQWVFAERERKS